MKIELKLVMISVALVMLLAVAGCTQPTVPEAETQLCSALGNLDLAIQDLEAIDQTSTVDELKAAEEQVVQAMSDVESAAADLESARKDELGTAFNNLEDAVKNVPDDATIEEGLNSITEERIAFRQAWQNLFEEVECSQ